MLDADLKKGFDKKGDREVRGNLVDKDNEYQRLRSLLLGTEYESVIREQLTHEDVDRVADVISEAFRLRNLKDTSLAEEMSPVIENSIDASIKTHPERITNVIFPIIGPAVRKAVSNSLSELMQSLNVMLTQALSFRSIAWRIKAWRLGIPYNQYFLLQLIHYRVEQVFFIHRETGVLIQSAIDSGILHSDPELVSSMLTAITDFANDSFNQQPDSLSVLQFNELNLLIETGPYAVIAFAVRGIVDNDLKQHLSSLVEKIHARYSDELSTFDGDIEPFASSEELLKKSLLKKEKIQDDNGRRPWMAIFFVGLLIAVASYFIYQYWAFNRSVNNIITQVDRQAGYQVLSHEYRDNELRLDVLTSPLAISSESLLDNILGTAEDRQYTVVINEELQPLGSAELFVPYLMNKYQAKLSVVSGDNEIDLIVEDEISKNNLAALEKNTVVKKYFNLILSDELNFTVERSEQEKNRQEIKSLVADINAQYFFFEVSSSILKEESRKILNTTLANLKKVINLQSSANVKIEQISVAGYADSQGSKAINESLSYERAKLIEDILKANGISEQFLVSWGYGVKDLKSVPSDLQRRAKIEVLYLPK